MKGKPPPHVDVVEGEYVYDDSQISARAATDFLGSLVLAQVIGVIEKARKDGPNLTSDAARAAGWLNYLGIAEGVTGEELIAECRAVLAPNVG